MIDMALIELDQLLGCSVDELIALVKPMSADNCEQHARAILGRLGGPSFEQLMMRILQTAAAKGVSPPPSDPDTYYFAVRGLFAHVAEDSPIRDSTTPESRRQGRPGSSPPWANTNKRHFSPLSDGREIGIKFNVSRQWDLPRSCEI
jgi:hypothetical protein